MSYPNPKIIVVDHEPSERPGASSNSSSQESGTRPELKDLDQLAKWMDSVFEIPGTKVKFGLDALLGLFPGVGDTLTSLVSIYILQSASQMGVSKLTMMRMAANIGVDYVVGVVPVLGDVFDVYWKSNEKNIALLRAHTSANPTTRRQLQRGDWIFLAILATGLITLLIGSMVVAFLIAQWLLSLISASLAH